MYRVLIIILFFSNISLAQEVSNKKSRFPLFELNKGGDRTKNVNWGNYHYENESYQKAISRYIKVQNPDVDVQRKIAKSYMNIDSVEKSISYFEGTLKE